LNINTKKITSLVQTDKAKYKPSDKVQFRVLFMNRNTQPVTPASITIVISDSGSNRVKQYNKVKLVKGVFQGELQLSELAPLGEWKIDVLINGVSNDQPKYFEVAKYTLPTFDLKVENDKIVAYREGKVSVKVLAKYTFGKLATGTATVTASYRRSGTFGGPFGRRPPPGILFSVSKQAEIDGKKPVLFDIVNDLQLKNNDRDVRVNLRASFTEELTGRQVSATGSVLIQKSVITIRPERYGGYIKPLPTDYTVIVKEKDLPVTDLKTPVVFNVTYTTDKLRTCKTSSNENVPCREEVKRSEIFRAFARNGFATISLLLDSKTTFVDVISTYRDAKAETINAAGLSENGEFIQVVLKNKM
jgi:uncharacterized protein YfaS (alpha-2-macroglobulin family)